MAKWTLTIEEEGGQTHRVDLVRDVYALGRDPSNDIVFRERNISRRHARLERVGAGRWAIVDEGSRYGCFINGERVDGRGVISPVDAIQIGGYHLSVLSSSGKRGGLAPALSVTRSLLVPVDVPPKLRIFDGLAPVADVRLDRGPVSLGSDSDCTVRLLGVEGALVHIRPLPGGTFEIVDRGDFVLVRLKGQELRRKILENADLFDLGDDLAVRFLQGGRHARTDEPDFSPSPLVDLSNGVAETKVLGVEGVPVLRQGAPKAPASSTLMGLQAPRPPPLPPSSASTPTDADAWPPGFDDDPTRAEPLRHRHLHPATQRIAAVRLPPQPPVDNAWTAAMVPALAPPGGRRPESARPAPPGPSAPTTPSAPPPPSEAAAWAAAMGAAQGAPPADMGWPMGQRAPSSTPGPAPDAWWSAAPPGAAGRGMTQRLERPAPPPPPLRRGLVALVVLGPLTAGVLATALLVAKLRPTPTPTPAPTADDTSTSQPDATAPVASTEPAASASASGEPASSAPPDASARPGAGKPGRPGKPPLSPEAERARQLRCQQQGKDCDLSPRASLRALAPARRTALLSFSIRDRLPDVGAQKAARHSCHARLEHEQRLLDFGHDSAIFCTTRAPFRRAPRPRSDAPRTCRRRAWRMPLRGFFWCRDSGCGGALAPLAFRP